MFRRFSKNFCRLSKNIVDFTEILENFTGNLSWRNYKTFFWWHFISNKISNFVLFIVGTKRRSIFTKIHFLRVNLFLIIKVQFWVLMYPNLCCQRKTQCTCRLKVCRKVVRKNTFQFLYDCNKNWGWKMFRTVKIWFMSLFLYNIFEWIWKKICTCKVFKNAKSFFTKYHSLNGF